LAHLNSDFGLLVRVVAFKITLQPNLNHLNWTSKLKVMPKIQTGVQTGILVRIGLGFGANFL